MQLSAKGSQYDIIYNDLTTAEQELLSTNIGINLGEYIVRWNKTYLVYDKDTEKYPIIQK